MPPGFSQAADRPAPTNAGRFTRACRQASARRRTDRPQPTQGGSRAHAARLQPGGGPTGPNQRRAVHARMPPGFSQAADRPAPTNAGRFTRACRLASARRRNGDHPQDRPKEPIARPPKIRHADRMPSRDRRDAAGALHHICFNGNGRSRFILDERERQILWPRYAPRLRRRRASRSSRTPTSTPTRTCTCG